MISAGGNLVLLRRQVPQSGRQDRQDPDVLLEFYKYPAEHWVHLRTTNPIESTFATVRLRTKVKGARIARCRTGYGLRAD
jgi:transposase-like protein